MPVQSSSSRVFRWPDRDDVLRDARAWAEVVGRRHPEVSRIVLFGFYARGRPGVGSDLDLMIEMQASPEPFGARLPDVVGTGLPVPADILVYTRDELARMRAEGRCFGSEIDDGVVLWRRDEVQDASTRSS